MQMTGIERLRRLSRIWTCDCKVLVEQEKLESIADQIEREQDALVKDSPYDALPPDERDAIAWVRKHGGLDAVNRRLMPEGMEWLVESWPRFEDDAPLVRGDEVMTSDGAIRAEELCLTICDRDGGVTSIDFGERVKRPAPKVLDADGAEIRVGDTVWTLKGARELEVTGLYPEQDSCPVKVKAGQLPGQGQGVQERRIHLFRRRAV